VLVTAPPEAGKTEMVMKYATNKGCVALTDCTAYGIMRDYKEGIEQRKVRHLIIPDFVRPLSRGKDTVHSLTAFLNSLIEEGILGISTYAETVKPDPTKTHVKCGLITTLAKGELLDGRHRWASMGFMSRLLPVSYTYTTAAQLKIHESIAGKEYLHEQPIVLELPDKDVRVKLGKAEGERLIRLTGLLTVQPAKGDAEKMYGFRLQKHLQRLVMANALKDARDITTSEDVDLLEDLSSVMNLEYNPL